MEDDIDIYEDLPCFNAADNENLAEKNKELAKKCTELERQVSDLTARMESLREVNKNLEVNLSSLLKTAKAEIARKDRLIAETRRELDDSVFRRGKFNRSAKPSRSGPVRTARDDYSDSKNDTATPEFPDTTEFVCDNPPTRYEEEDTATRQTYRPDKVSTTVFGERLRKRLLEEQEAERRTKEQSRIKVEHISVKSESDKENGLKCNDKNKENQPDSVKLESKMTGSVTSQSKPPSLSSISSLNSHEDCGFPRRKKAVLISYRDRKRTLDDHADRDNCKKLKSEDDRNRHRDRSRHNDDGNRPSGKTVHRSDNSHSRPRNDFLDRPEEKNTDTRLDDDIVFGDIDQYRVLDEYRSSPPPQQKRSNNEKAVHGDSRTEDKQSRVASRLMLLAEGIDPDYQPDNYFDARPFKRTKDDKKPRHRNEDTSSPNRPKSRNQENRNDKNKRHRSRSRTPERNYNDKRRNRNHGNRHRSGGDRFDRRRDLKNKDGDNLSEFSREIYELKERIEHRFDDKDDNRKKTRKIAIKSEVVESSSRSRSRERRRSRSSGTRSVNVGETTAKRSESTVTIVMEDGQITESKYVSRSSVNVETKSLHSLEDGEIVDTPGTSPGKVKDQTSPAELKIPSEINLTDSDEANLKIDDDKSPSALPRFENTRSNDGFLFQEKSSMPSTRLTRSQSLTYSHNISKEERIENIEEFIKNYSVQMEDTANGVKHENFGRNGIPGDTEEGNADAISKVDTAVETNLKLTSERETSVENIQDILSKTSDDIVVAKNDLNVEITEWKLIEIDDVIGKSAERLKINFDSIQSKTNNHSDSAEENSHPNEEFMKLPEEKSNVKIEIGEPKTVPDKSVIIMSTAVGDNRKIMSKESESTLKPSENVTIDMKMVTEQPEAVLSNKITESTLTTKQKIVTKQSENTSKLQKVDGAVIEKNTTKSEIVFHKSAKSTLGTKKTAPKDKPVLKSIYSRSKRELILSDTNSHGSTHISGNARVDHEIVTINANEVDSDKLICLRVVDFQTEITNGSGLDPTEGISPNVEDCKTVNFSTNKECSVKQSKLNNRDSKNEELNLNEDCINELGPKSVVHSETEKIHSNKDDCAERSRPENIKDRKTENPSCNIIDSVEELRLKSSGDSRTEIADENNIEAVEENRLEISGDCETEIPSTAESDRTNKIDPKNIADSTAKNFDTNEVIHPVKKSRQDPTRDKSKPEGKGKPYAFKNDAKKTKSQPNPSMRSDESNNVTKAGPKSKTEGGPNIKSKNEHCKTIVFARRRKPVQLMDASTCMTVVVTANSFVDTNSNVESSTKRSSPSKKNVPKSESLAKAKRRPAEKNVAETPECLKRTSCVLSSDSLNDSSSDFDSESSKETWNPKVKRKARLENI